MKLHMCKPFAGKWSVAALFTLLLLVATGSSYGQEDYDAGEALFGANCASCHKPDENSTGPALQGARQRWADAGEADNIYKWIANPVGLAGSGESPYAVNISKYDASAMTAQGHLSKVEVDNILFFVDNYVKAGPVAGLAECYVVPEQKKGGVWKWLLIISTILAFVIVVLGSSARRLKEASDEYETDEDKTYLERIKDWAWNNKALVGIGGLLIVFVLLSDLGYRAALIDVNEGYSPSQPIEFSHCVHAGNLEIDCKYCHNSVEKSKSAGIPTVNVCMNCHKSVNEGTYTGKSQIAKIYEAAGYDLDKREYDIKKSKPIVWNKVHNLPDHVYFNHSQHVAVGEIDCKQCHGDVKQIDVGRVMHTSEINELEGVTKLTKPVLTMGWCIECHNETGIDIGKNAYYTEIHDRLKKDPELLKKYMEDDKVSVRELGGWECAKCHY